ncbi:protoporphyrinogen/coproporphyrinogen oxidase [Marinomonas sp. GJ51-6]|uniref:protoporphyrinogen/coproporphyrinogen oxidase n=1 Tax=Marinomonas sp. GJ51-6 TaxID=2992802 RepID=UPI0029342EA6|nr:FAD-dependent oxidoreductase [Marinomonas sp. GJ51-6]WOD06221.1 FAD-dependent oxidoreductase [Marinomonas sp. GJ51-6]
MMKKVDVLILGAGIAGLGAALKAREQGRQAVIFESKKRAGGLLDNFEVEGFRFDNAVHLSFASEDKVRNIFDQTDFYTHPADAWNFDKDKWLKHPVQNNLFPLSSNEKVKLIKSFLDRPETLEENYESWLRHQYGDAIAERYPIRYTQKYWATPANKLSTTWIGNRMRRAELDEILFGSYTDETPNTYYTKEMRYPKKGGFKAFIEPLIAETNIVYSHCASSIDTSNKLVTFSNGNQVQYEELVSSIPLPILTKITKNVPQDILSSSKKLTATSIDLISVGFKGDFVKDLWFYIYDEDILASRAYSPSVKSPDNAPENYSSLQFEVYSRDINSDFTEEKLFENVKYAIDKMNICQPNDILFLHHKHLPYGNVIFDQGMENHRDLVREFLKKGVKTIGRFGEWDYLWSNQSFLSGYFS